LENGDMQEEKLGTIRIAPSVLAMIVSLTASAVKGVATMSPVSRPPSKVLHRPNTGNATGVSLHVRNGTILADVYIVAEPDTNLQKLGHTVQERVREALNQMVDISAEQVNVYIEDVSE
jgi:uncharacterized alkaline shock family protein YloU